jgi:hypothetical protein
LEAELEDFDESVGDGRQEFGSQCVVAQSNSASASDIQIDAAVSAEFRDGGHFTLFVSGTGINGETGVRKTPDNGFFDPIAGSYAESIPELLNH